VIAIKRCAALTKDGGRCQRLASDGSDYCFSHDPAKADERHRSAKKAGLTGGRGRPRQGPSAELTAVKRELREVIEAVRDGSLDRGTGAVIGGLYNTWLRALETERRWHESDELEQRLSALEELAARERGAVKPSRRFGI
jgi:hypothetical protein